MLLASKSSRAPLPTRVGRACSSTRGTSRRAFEATRVSIQEVTAVRGIELTLSTSLSRLSTWAAGKALLQPHTYDMSLCLTHRVDFGGRLTVKTDGVHSAGREVWGYSGSLTDRLQVRAWSAKLQTCSSVVAKRSTVLRAALSAACSRYLAEGDYHASTRERRSGKSRR